MAVRVLRDDDVQEFGVDARVLHHCVVDRLGQCQFLLGRASFELVHRTKCHETPWSDSRRNRSMRTDELEDLPVETVPDRGDYPQFRVRESIIEHFGPIWRTRDALLTRDDQARDNDVRRLRNGRTTLDDPRHARLQSCGQSGDPVGPQLHEVGTTGIVARRLTEHDLHVVSSTSSTKPRSPMSATQTRNSARWLDGSARVCYPHKT